MISSLTRNFKDKTGKMILTLLLGTLLLCGCEGPSTTVLPNEARETPSESLPAAAPLSSSERIYEAVNTLYTAKKESFGRDYTSELSDTYTAADPTVYILSVLRDCSYDVIQTGEIIEAVLKAETADPDICLLIACYGGYGDGTSASDVAAGAAVLLETAESLARMPGDTEIRFVFLPGERYETEPIYTYLEELYSIDADRLLGAVLIGGLGLDGAADNVLGCPDGNATFMAERINRVCRSDLGRECILQDCSEGVMNVLLRNRIPTTLYAQKEDLRAGTVLDTPSAINYGSLQESADILSHTLALLMEESTPSMRARAHYTDSGIISEEGAFSWGKESVLPFGETEQTLESLTGLLGELVSENTDNAGDELIGYRFPMKWFEMDEIIPGDFYYTGDALTDISLRAFEAGIDYGKITDAITAVYGPSDDKEGPYGFSHEWVVSMQRMSITLQPQKTGYALTITLYDTPQRPLRSGSLGAERLIDLFEKVIPETARSFIDFEAYTDGYGATVGTLAPKSAGTDNKSWLMGLDMEDALNTDASFRDKPRTVAELARLYGEYLAKDDPLVYYDTYHSRFGGDENDFAEAFRLFAISEGSLDGAGLAAAPVRYFCDFDELMEFRDTVKKNLD